ncbi:MAG: hypothetical protein US54_C0079G0012 [Candidatus Roizmanbacteria bacterium GW2011_GWA2_37_7]|uniref:Uncharacterized protein n=1 Tax=Candidatus Roizmanbacteria bacterium GW2011_GWA2_37_7 TaxID=1618481 RepID=A0A0G0K689_9BACT|nr:MAG: hypothetical protein US54_C0079G0012 [Candidatus Roizmanbacteria bacterium GW2011_GWA2_37_7]
MWFHSNFFVPPSEFLFNGEQAQLKATSFTFSGEMKEK